MRLRIKFLLPLAVFGAFLAVYLCGYWIPHGRVQTETDYRQTIERHLDTVAEGVTPLLLGRQLDAVYEFFDVLKERNPDWTGIEYIDREGRTVYPLEPPRPAKEDRTGRDIRTVRRQIKYLDRDLGTIVLSVDFAPRVNEMNEHHRELMVTLLAVLIAYVATAWLVVEWVVRRPVDRLAHASRKLAGGVFDVPLPKTRNDEVGILVGSFAGMRDAIRSYQAELVERSSVLRKSEQRLAEAQRLSHLGSWELDLTTNTLTWSDEIYRIFGMDPQAFGATYEAFLVTVHPDDRASVDSAYTGSVRDNFPYDIVHRIVRRSDGAVRFVHEKAEHVRDASGAVIRSLGTVQDITEIRLTEEALRRSERKLALHLQQTVLGVIEWDREFRATEWNPAAEAIFGYRREEALGRRAFDLILPAEIVGDIDVVWNRLLRQTGGTHSVNENVTRDGQRILCEWFNTPIADETGTVVSVMSLAQDITERSRAEETSRLLGSIVENSDDAIIGKTLDGIITSWNRGAEAVYGYHGAEVIGKPIAMLIPDERKDEETQILGKLRRGEHIEHFETIRKRKDRKLINVSLSTSPIKDSQDRIIGASTIARDITERKLAEEELKRAGAYNRSLIEASLDPLVTIDAHGKITDVNDATEKVTGFSREELLGTDFSDYFTAPEKARAGYQQAFREGTVRDYALEIRRRDGQVTPVLYNASVYRDEAGNIVGVFAAARDITERKRAEEVLKRAGAYNRSLIEASLDPLVTIDAHGKITDVNDATEKVTGFSREELLGTDFSDYFTEPEKARAGYQQVFREGTVRDYPLEIRRRDAHVTSVLYNASVYRDEDGNIVGVFAAARDITERKRAEEDLKRLTLRNEMILNSAGEGIYGADIDGNIVFMNQAAQEMLALRMPDVIGKKSHQIFHHTRADGKPYPFEECPMHKSLAKGETYRGLDEVFWTRDGTMFAVEQVSTPLVDHGAVVGAVVVFRDITERKRAEEEIRKLNEGLEKRIQKRTDDLQKKSSELEESQRALMNIVEDLNLKSDELEKANAKLKELDRLKSMFIASMSHELRTPLNSVIGFSSILLSEWLGPVNAEQKENLATILRSGKHLLNLINDVIDVSKIEAGKVESRAEEFDLYDLVSEAAGLVRVSARDKGLSLLLDIHHQPMCTDKRRLLQCVLNLLSNAVKFTEKGSITVRTCPVPGAPELVELSVEDTGIGVREEDLPKLFQPFVRLVLPHEATIVGTGLGLYLTNKLTKEILKGDILCTSTYGKGSTFVIRIPARIA